MYENKFKNPELRTKLEYALNSFVFSNNPLRKELADDFNKLLTVIDDGGIFINLSIFPPSYHDKFIKGKFNAYSSALIKRLSGTLSFFLAVNRMQNHQFMFTIVDGSQRLLMGLFTRPVDEIKAN